MQYAIRPQLLITRVCCAAVRSAILAAAWLLVKASYRFFHSYSLVFRTLWLCRNWQRSSDCGIWLVHCPLHFVVTTRDRSRRTSAGRKITSDEERHQSRSSVTPVRAIGPSSPAIDNHNIGYRNVASWCFYRAMHFSAKRGIAIACRLSVRLSVCNVGEL